jgi:hypothetical protein
MGIRASAGSLPVLTLPRACADAWRNLGERSPGKNSGQKPKSNVCAVSILIIAGLVLPYPAEASMPSKAKLFDCE